MPNFRHKKSVTSIGPLLVLVLAVIALPSSAAAMNSEFCEVLNRWNAEKKISDPEVRARYEGEYGRADDAEQMKTWNIETVCGDFLVAVPLWADVSPPVLAHQGGDIFKDAMESTWKFQVGSDGAVIGVTMTTADGTATEMTRLGDPRSFD